MKKIFSILLAISFLTVMMTPMLALAQGPASSCRLKHTIQSGTSFMGCTQGVVVSEAVTQEWGMCCLLDALYTATDWIFIALIVIVGLFIIWGGFNIATAGGDPQKVSSGKNMIMYALIGLVLATFSKALPAVVKALLGV